MPNATVASSHINISQWITWGMVFLGWLVINSQHNKREDRKELRSIIDEFKNRIYLLEERAISYHCAPDVTLAQSNQIKLDIQRLIGDIRLQGIFNSEEMTRIFKELRRAITLNNFESAKHEALSHDHVTLTEIHEAVDDLLGNIETHFRNKYPFQ